MIKADITAVPFEDGEFDVILCNHVLEHVADDRKAMRELYRVLAPGGRLYMLQPVWLETGATVEDPSVTAPGERRKLFGQRDHVRIYGHDVIDRLESAGFDVRLEHYARRISREEIARHGFQDEPIFICRRSGS